MKKCLFVVLTLIAFLNIVLAQSGKDETDDPGTIGIGEITSTIILETSTKLRSR